MKQLNVSVSIVGFVSLIMLFCNSPDSFESSTSTKNSGIEGVVLKGPIHGGPIQVGEGSEEGFKALFHVHRNQKLVTTFQSTEDGSFHVSLEPGTYDIVPDTSAPIMNAQRQVKEVTVKAKQITIDTLHFDTGLR